MRFHKQHKLIRLTDVLGSLIRETDTLGLLACIFHGIEGLDLLERSLSCAKIRDKRVPF